MVAVALLLSACSSPPYEFVGSAPCGVTGGAFETWCTEGNDCEFRVIGGITTSCRAGDYEGCRVATQTALDACLAGEFDAGMPDVGPVDAPIDAPLPCTGSAELDLLFMIDNSNSMLAEQGLLRAEIPRAITELATHASLHVGVVTSDMGAGPSPVGIVPSCLAGFGDDGIMRITSRGGAGCATSYPSRVFTFEGAASGVPAFATAIGCVADLGTGGCGFEQQLEAVLKAVSPVSPQPWVSSSYVAPTFAAPSAGHGDRENDGFLRADSVLALVLLTDEEDCSVPEYDIFYMDDPDYRGNPLNLRCSRFGASALYPTARYVNGFLQLRSSASRLVYAPIVGVPADLVGSSYEAMLSDPRMEETEEPAVPPQRLLPSCDGANGVAFPPRRIVDVARGLRDGGAYTTVQSICDDSLGDGMNEIVGVIRHALTCAP